MVCVSCIVIFYQAGKYLREAIASVFAQRYESWELILVDDGSTDVGTALALACAAEHPDRVRYVQHEGHANRGMSASRNAGVAASRGEFVAFLDADDVWLPEKLASQVEILRDRPEAMMVYDAARYWYPRPGATVEGEYGRLRRLGFPPGTLVHPPDLVPLFLGDESETPGTCSVLLRRSAFDRIGGFVESFRGMYEDQAFFYKLCLELPVYLSGEVTSLYRQHPDSACHVAVRENVYDPHGRSLSQDVFLDWLAAYVADRLRSRDAPARHLPDAVKDELLCRLGFAPFHRFRRLLRKAARRAPLWRRIRARLSRFRDKVV
ncbi:Putative glycosyltransferase EpsE [Aquisphaera giovannonii]|uniref:Glycosyltransferase EpsE n=1 Tax=Aquisphaera giovannonii TaxID=406548 RepID=A0A5B9W748_9BACT|nr:glycosyltransferase family A protein [Aquisphaera giovannonii]QEH36383.1 Putative glycosyltransferase EpsE [Aquisphaera giovannonii]